MADTASPRQSSGSGPQLGPAPPGAALFPGAVLLFLGLWLVTGGGPLPVGWAVFSTGLTMVLLGAVAQGVAWGLELHDARRR